MRRRTARAAALVRQLHAYECMWLDARASQHWCDSLVRSLELRRYTSSLAARCAGRCTSASVPCWRTLGERNGARATLCPAGVRSAQALIDRWQVLTPDLTACWGRLCLIPASRLFARHAVMELDGSTMLKFP